MQITISRALTELKTLDSRINKTINGARFILGCKQSATKIDGINTRDEFGKDAQSSYDSIEGLIKRRNNIKTNIVSSNAITIINVAGKEMTVAEGIERKNSIELEKTLLATMKSQYNSAIASVQRANDQVDIQLQQHLQTMLGTEVKNKETTDSFTESFRKNNGYEVIDPLKLKEKINVLEKEIDNFEMEIDAILSESNAITKIEIED